MVLEWWGQLDRCGRSLEAERLRRTVASGKIDFLTPGFRTSRRAKERSSAE
jgi:hypothetical protein